MSVLDSIGEIDWDNRTVQLAAVGTAGVVLTYIMLNRANKAKAEANSAAQQAASVPVNYVAYGTTNRSPIGVIGYVGDEDDPIPDPGINERELRLNLLGRRASELSNFVLTFLKLLPGTKRGKKKALQTQIQGGRTELEGVITEIESLGGTYTPPEGVFPDPDAPPPPPPGNGNNGGNNGGSNKHERIQDLREKIAVVKADIQTLDQEKAVLREQYLAAEPGSPERQNLENQINHKNTQIAEQERALRRLQQTLKDVQSRGNRAGGEGPRRDTRLLMTLGRMAPRNGFRGYYGYGRVGAAPVAIPAPINYGVDYLGSGETLKQFARRTLGHEMYWPNIASKNRLTGVPRAGTPLEL